MNILLLWEHIFIKNLAASDIENWDETFTRYIYKLITDNYILISYYKMYHT